jgi:exportin-2 (importin alpha re-exporter)
MLAQLLFSAGPAMLPIAPKILEFLLSLLAKACSNQEAQGFVNALYGHYLFECMAVIIAHAAKSGDVNTINQIQQTLFDPCKQIMAIESLSPYALQLMTQMLDIQPHANGIPAAFQPLFVELTKVFMWDNHGNIPALVRLLQVYLKKQGADMVVGQQLQAVLGVVNKLICSRSTEGYSFELLNCVVCFLPRHQTDPFMQGIMNLVFTRLMSGKTQRFIAEVIQFICIYIGKHDLATVIRCVEGIQAGAFANFTMQMWIPGLQNVVGNQHKKHCVIGMTTFLVDAQVAGWLPVLLLQYYECSCLTLTKTLTLILNPILILVLTLNPEP